MAESSPEPTNVFRLVAYLLWSVRHSLEDEDTAQSPRWVRIARARSAPAGSLIGDGVKLAVGGFATVVVKMQHLAIELKELLYLADSAKATAEVAADLLLAAVSPEFLRGLDAALGGGESGARTAFLKALSDALAQTSNNVMTAPLKQVVEKLAAMIKTPADGGQSVSDLLTDWVKTAKGVIDQIPEPGDVDAIGQELFSLLCIVQKPFGTIDAPGFLVSDTERVNVAATGKVRLLAWAFDQGLAAPVGDLDVKRLGSRRVLVGKTEPTRSEGIYVDSGRRETIFAFTFPTPPVDIDEMNRILAKLGYTNTDLAERLRDFQMCNDLPTTRTPDDHTINRLLGLDLRNRVLVRPTAYREDLIRLSNYESGIIPLANGTADEPPDAGIISLPPTSASVSGYSYYEMKEGSGWRSQTEPKIKVPRADLASGDATGWVETTPVAKGFVALESRRLRLQGGPPRMVPDFTDGAPFYLSEGEAAFGRFFFAARQVEPWIPGRSGTPTAYALFNAQGEKGGSPLMTQMYQWLTRKFDLERHTVKLRLCALQRGLYKEVMRDQGRLRIELHRDFPADGARPIAPENSVIAFAQTGWEPANPRLDDRATARLTQDDPSKKVWVACSTPPVTLTPDTQGVLVVLEGKRNTGVDIDAFFDNVHVTYEAIPKQQGS